MQPFVHLHLHTEYSLLDGATKLNQLFKKCETLCMPAVAMTDHGNMFAACKFDAEAMLYSIGKKIEAEDWAKAGHGYKIKPIFGCEFYVCDDMSKKESVAGRAPKLNHLVLLAKDYEGFLNLAKLGAESYINGYYYKPRIDRKLLEGHTKGLVCLSACLAGEIPQYLLAGNYEKAKNTADYYKSLFDKGDYYIEIQDHDILEQKETNPQLIKIARELGIKVVATNDVHYLEKEDAEMQKVLQCIAFKRPISDTLGSEGETYFPTQEFYLKSYDQMAERFGYIPEALDNTLEIANKCNVLLKYKQDLIPSYLPPEGESSYQYLRKLTFEGLAEKYPEVTPQITDRAEYELDIVNRLGFVDYFLIVWDFIHYAESIGIPVGPGRGSGVGSIVAYATGITKVEPLRYNLLFERFLNEERVSMPDFDIDFCFERRGEVIEYVIKKYGADRVSQIITFGTLAIKAAIKDVGRVYGVPYSETDKMTKAVGRLNPTSKLHLADLLGRGKPNTEIKDLVDIYNTDDEARKVLDMACKVEGMPRQIGMHAAGVVICKDPISDHIPQARSGEDVTTQFDMNEVEKLGMLKMDFLGLRTLTDISKAIEIVKQVHGVDIDFYHGYNYDDQKVYDLISRGDTHAVFQLESEGMKDFMRRLKPNSLEDIIAGISLYRPGPMDSIDNYVDCKNNPEKIKYDHPLLEPILGVTYGSLVYQEQVMNLVRALAGYSLGGADILRRAMSKKKKDVMAKNKQIFIHGGESDGKAVEGAVKRGVPAEVANIIFEKVEKFAEYAFNKSHATAYAYLSYQTAFLKCYYKAEFITAVLNNRISNADELKNYLPYAKNSGIEIYPPSVNDSLALFSVENGGIRIGLAAIKNVGRGIMEALVAERDKNGPFLDFGDFCSRVDEVGCNKKMYESLIKGGAFDCFKKLRSQLMQIYPSVVDKYAADRAARLSGQFSLFESLNAMESIEYPDIPEFEHTAKLKEEKELVGLYVTGHPLDEYKDFLADSANTTEKFMSTGQSEEGDTLYENVHDGQIFTISGMLVAADRIVTKKNLEMGIGRLEDLFGTVDVMLSPNMYHKIKSEFVADSVITLSGKVSVREGDVPKIWIDKIIPYKKPLADTAPVREKKKTLNLTFDADSMPEDVKEILREIFKAHAGETDCVAVHPRSRQTRKIGKVSISNGLLFELAAIIPSRDIAVVTF